MKGRLLNKQTKKGGAVKEKCGDGVRKGGGRSHKPDNSSLILGPMVERENRLLKVVHMHTIVFLTPPLTRTDTTNK